MAKRKATKKRKSRVNPLQVRDFDLSVNSQLAEYTKIRSEYSHMLSYQRDRGIHTFIKSEKKSNLYFSIDGKKIPVYPLWGATENHAYIVDGKLYAAPIGEIDFFMENGHTQYVPSAVIVPKLKRRKANRSLANPIVLNGDEDCYSSGAAPEDGDVPQLSLVGYTHGGDKNYELPTISFRCLAELLDISSIEVGECLAEGTIEIVDYEPDVEIKLTSVERKQLRRKQNLEEFSPLKPPLGFALVDNKWHRSATALLRQGDRKFLIGQDEGTYFGCELQSEPKANTIKQAFANLMPPEARNKKGVVRQGEWFLVPVNEKNVPSVTDAIALFSNEYDSKISLPIDDPESSHHILSATDGRISKEGVFFAQNPYLEHEHEEHAPVDGRGWFSFHRNTAIQSVSVEGVD